MSKTKKHVTSCSPEPSSPLGSHPLGIPELIAIAISTNGASANRAISRLIQEEEQNLRHHLRESAPTPEPRLNQEWVEDVALKAASNVHKMIEEAKEKRRRECETAGDTRN